MLNLNHCIVLGSEEKHCHSLRLAVVQDGSVALPDEGVLLVVDLQDPFHRHERQAPEDGPLKLRRHLWNKKE